MYSVCVIGYVQYCYVFVSDGVTDDVLFVVIVAVKAFMAQLLSPRQISLNGTIKYIVKYRIVSYLRCYVYSCGITCIAYFTRPLYIEEF